MRPSFSNTSSQYLLLLDAPIIQGVLNSRLRAKAQLHAEPSQRRPAAERPPTGDVMHDFYRFSVESLYEHVLRLMQNKPIQILRRGGVTRIRVCGAFDFVVDRKHRRILTQAAPTTESENASPLPSVWSVQFKTQQANVNVLHPLCNYMWLSHIAVQPGWLGFMPIGPLGRQQQQLFLDSKQMLAYADSMLTAVYRRLLKHPAFGQMWQDLARLLAQEVGPRLLDLAMRSRLNARAPLTAAHVNLVWGQLEAYQQVAKDNPKLLSAVTAWLHSPHVREFDPQNLLAQIRQSMLAIDLPPRAWRLLAKVGLFKLVDVSSMRRPELAWDELLFRLIALQAARWPALPPREFWDFLLHLTDHPSQDFLSPGSASGWFWRICIEQASRYKADPRSYLALKRRILDWHTLANARDLYPDANQLRKGSDWLQAQCEELNREREYSIEVVWSTWLLQVDFDAIEAYEVVPIVTRQQLHNVVVALHNCALTLEERLKDSELLLIALRSKSTKRFLALIGLEPKSGRWTISQVAGPCNQPVSASLRQAAQVVRKEVNAFCPF
jgi:hypothetical protein